MEAELFKVNEVLFTKMYLSVVHALSTNKAVSAWLVTKLLEGSVTEQQFAHHMESYCDVRVHGVPCLHLRINLLQELYENNLEQLWTELFRFNKVRQDSKWASDRLMLPTVPTDLGYALDSGSSARKLGLQPVRFITSLEDGHRARRLRDERRFEYKAESSMHEAVYWKCAKAGCEALAFSYEKWILVNNVHNHELCAE